MTIAVLLADDHAIVRDGLKTLLQMQPDLRVVGEAANGREAVAAAAQLEPDVAVMDISAVAYYEDPRLKFRRPKRRLARRRPNSPCSPRSSS